MALFVQKFGGTSVGDPSRIARCAARVKQRVDEGHRVVVVVSAMGHATDELIELASNGGSGEKCREVSEILIFLLESLLKLFVFRYVHV